MKVNQIVGEHAKGMRAKIYANKPKNTIAPKKPLKKHEIDKDVHEDGEMVKQYEPGKSVTVDNPNTGVSTTVDLTKSPGALAPTDKGELQLDPTPNAGTTGAETTNAPKITPGAPVKIAPDNNTTAEEGILDFLSGTSPEEYAKTSTQMATLLQFREKYKGTQYADQIEKRIQALKSRLDLAGEPGAGMGAPVDASGNPKQVVPPEKFDTKQLKEADRILLDKMLTIAGLR